jgi:hypothetical protein
MVASKYVPLLDGVSYVDVVPFQGEHTEIRRAVAEANRMSKDVLCVQVCGNEEDVRDCTYIPSGASHALTDSFAKEPWRIFGRLKDWKTHPPLVFDRRDRDREYDTFKPLLRELAYNRSKGLEIVLVNTAAESSPFEYGELLWELLRARVKAKRRLVDLSKIRVERLYDLIGLYELAHCLVSVDSAPLHLARAVPTLPVLAISQDKPLLWNGSPWRPNHVFQCRYSRFPAHAVELLDRMDAVGQPGCISRRVAIGGTMPRIFHVYPGHETSHEERNRLRPLWLKLYCEGIWVDSPIDVGALGRDTRSVFKDKQRLPFLEDVLNLACARMEERDIICLTRGPVSLYSTATKAILNHTPCYSHRVVDGGLALEFSPAVDVFCFTKGWWLRHRKEIPDLVLGNDHHWHRVLMEHLRRDGAVHIPWLGERLYRPPKVAEGGRPPRVEYNERLAVEALRELGNPPLFRPLHEQRDGVKILSRAALGGFGYNPTLWRRGDTLLMVFRAHHSGAATALHVAELDNAFNVLSVSPLECEGDPGFNSMEDARFFEWRGRLMLSFVNSRLVSGAPFCSVVRVGELTGGPPWRLRNVWRPDYGRNDGSAMEKNWVFFERSGRLFAFYSQGPREQVTVEFDDSGRVVAEHKAPSLLTINHDAGDQLTLEGWTRWPFGCPKGGTVPLDLGDGRMFRVFHSTLDNEPRPHRRRYYCGLALMESEPPFRPLHFYRQPLFYGSEADDLTETERASCPHHKPKVVFPGGLTWANPAKAPLGGVILSLGVNDSACALARVSYTRFKI